MPQKFKAIQECAFAAYTNHPRGMGRGPEATHYHDPPNPTFGSYICVVDIGEGVAGAEQKRRGAVASGGDLAAMRRRSGKKPCGLQGPGMRFFRASSDSRSPHL